MHTQIRQWDDDLVVVIPQEIAAALNLSPGDDVQATVEGGRIVIAPTGHASFTLEALLAQITDNNVYPEIDGRNAVGSERW